MPFWFYCSSWAKPHSQWTHYTLNLWLPWNLKAARELHLPGIHDQQLQYCHSILVSFCGWLICNCPKDFWNLLCISQTGQLPSFPTALQNLFKYQIYFPTNGISNLTIDTSSSILFFPYVISVEILYCLSYY